MPVAISHFLSHLTLTLFIRVAGLWKAPFREVCKRKGRVTKPAVVQGGRRTASSRQKERVGAGMEAARRERARQISRSPSMDEAAAANPARDGSTSTGSFIHLLKDSLKNGWKSLAGIV